MNQLPGPHQAIIWTNAGILLIGPQRTNFSEILIEIHTFSFKKIHLNMSSGKWHPFCLSLNVLSCAKDLDKMIYPKTKQLYQTTSLWILSSNLAEYLIEITDPKTKQIEPKVCQCFYNILYQLVWTKSLSIFSWYTISASASSTHHDRLHLFLGLVRLMVRCWCVLRGTGSILS